MADSAKQQRLLPPRQEPSPAEDKRWAIKLARESRRGEEALQAGARNAI